MIPVGEYNHDRTETSAMRQQEINRSDPLRDAYIGLLSRVSESREASKVLKQGRSPIAIKW